MMNPTPMVITISISFSIADLMNKNNRLTQTSNAMSKGGILSERPDITASILGTNTKFKTTTANHCKVSAVVELKWVK